MGAIAFSQWLPAMLSSCTEKDCHTLLPVVLRHARAGLPS